jgi:hypothetical protein
VKFYYVDFLHFDIDFLFVFDVEVCCFHEPTSYFSDPAGFEGLTHFLGVNCSLLGWKCDAQQFHL